MRRIVAASSGGRRGGHRDSPLMLLLGIGLAIVFGLSLLFHGSASAARPRVVDTCLPGLRRTFSHPFQPWRPKGAISPTYDGKLQRCGDDRRGRHPHVGDVIGPECHCCTTGGRPIAHEHIEPDERTRRTIRHRLRRPRHQSLGSGLETSAVAVLSDQSDGLAGPVTSAVTALSGPATQAGAPVTNAVAPVTNAVAPVTNAVAPVVDAVALGDERRDFAVTDAAAPVTSRPWLASPTPCGSAHRRR